jgi:hypothetical protein
MKETGGGYFAVTLQRAPLVFLTRGTWGQEVAHPVYTMISRKAWPPVDDRDTETERMPGLGSQLRML